ncbi:hypothetical protein [Sphingobacterium ginsenosidimutans]|uniref:hypothetical protein n=1 Tax=Sphingobacterium ginsenosidimutans TaxID=687845 RepID=UPI0031F9D9BE
MRTKRIILGHATPPIVHHAGTLRLGADAILPMVRIRKAAAGPTQVGDIQVLERFDHIRPYAIGMRDRIVLFPHIKSIVNTAAQVFGKMAVNMFADRDILCRRLQFYAALSQA